jgi:hypothetical protein
MANAGLGTSKGRGWRGASRAAVVVAGALLTLALGASVAAAEPAFIEPSSDPVRVTVADDGWPAAVTVKVGGWEPYENVFIEQCNGRTPEDADWTPAVDCDPGSAPAAAIADESGVATFAADDPNHAFRPFVGTSPQRSFNCLGPDAPSPDNEIDVDFRDCQIRVSPSNTQSSSDQVFLRMELPDKAREWSPEIVPGAVTSQEAPGSGRETGSAAAGTGSDQDTAANASASSGSRAGDSASDGLAAPAVAGLLFVAAALGVGAFFVVRRRRTGQVTA